jgi:hypothetical protein
MKALKLISYIAGLEDEKVEMELVYKSKAIKGRQ